MDFFLSRLYVVICLRGRGSSHLAAEPASCSDMDLISIVQRLAGIARLWGLFAHPMVRALRLLQVDHLLAPPD